MSYYGFSYNAAPNPWSTKAEKQWKPYSTENNERIMQGISFRLSHDGGEVLVPLSDRRAPTAGSVYFAAISNSGPGSLNISQFRLAFPTDGSIVVDHRERHIQPSEDAERACNAKDFALGSTFLSTEQVYRLFWGKLRELHLKEIEELMHSEPVEETPLLKDPLFWFKRPGDLSRENPMGRGSNAQLVAAIHCLHRQARKAILIPVDIVYDWMYVALVCDKDAITTIKTSCVKIEKRYSSKDGPNTVIMEYELVIAARVSALFPELTFRHGTLDTDDQHTLIHMPVYEHYRNVLNAHVLGVGAADKAVLATLYLTRKLDAELSGYIIRMATAPLIP